VKQQCPTGVHGQGLALMRNNGGQPTSTTLMRACGSLGSQRAFPSDNHPKGNADTERVRRTLREEGLWRQEWTCPFPFARVLKTWVDAYNEQYLHSIPGLQATQAV
jgi:putative transposase